MYEKVFTMSIKILNIEIQYGTEEERVYPITILNTEIEYGIEEEERTYTSPITILSHSIEYEHPIKRMNSNCIQFDSTDFKSIQHKDFSTNLKTLKI